MVESQSRFGKPSWSGETLNSERDQERAVDFQFSVTWSAVFAPSVSPKSADAISSVSNRTPTLVTGSKEPPPAREERALMKPNVEELPSPPRQKPDASFSVAWEMVVPKMVRSAPKAADQPVQSSALLEHAEPDAASASIPDQNKPAPLTQKRVLIGLAITLIGIFALLAIHHWWPRQKQIAAPPPIASPLKLEVQPEANGLVDVRWNPGSAIVAQARQARLVIMERDQQPKTLTLSPDQLKSGHLPFQPLGDRVVFRLEVEDRSGALTKESVLTQSSSMPAAPPTPVPAQAETKPSPVGKTPHNTVADDDEDTGRVAKPAASPADRTPSRAFTPPPVTQHNSNGRAILPEPPTVLPNISTTSSIRIPDPGERVSPPPAKQASVPPLATGGDLLPGKLIKKITPVYPPMAQSSRVQGIVRFNATIAKDGTIRNLQLVTGPSLLVQAAADAVKQWVYEPTKLNGNPVEVETQINVSFTLSK